MRTPFIAGNWKMNVEDADALAFIDAVKDRIPPKENVESAVCAQAVSLKDMKKRAEDTELMIGAQNVHEEASGAFTGEISAPALTSIGIQLVIIGHSERRELFNDSDERVNLKLHAALKHGMTPIVCVGESLEEREAGRAVEVVRGQLQKALEGVSAQQVDGIVIAYEPVWAIGTGKSSNPEEAGEMCKTIRSYIREQYGESSAEAVRIQYGGSVKPDNIADYLADEDIDGALVGGASIKVESFLSLLEAASR
ncbi:triose-phosphate isomerase [Natribacillus halophilus]|uniref:Triosephosphate isomerase n=1 Tax=Natribacillus halophilus TaxID=549003 RepID=A0A1G8KKN0_9BACI|nr:triose-phosphate isomerase [Natribacillus halophilus]SDI43997.1 triosephosphate isomerase [Natribacillus halophilus]